jgi:hypothetical protein
MSCWEDSTSQSREELGDLDHVLTHVSGDVCLTPRIDHRTSASAGARSLT